ncbi:MAG: hypothetical protein R3B09_16105 [Nannocystaceae bacterium]
MLPRSITRAGAIARRAHAARIAGAALLACAALSACNGSKPASADTPAPAPAPANAGAPAASATPPAAPADPAPFATPNAPPPPAPEGAVLLTKPALHVQRCDPAHPCPKLLQPAGEAHCRGLELSGVKGWRLPDVEEAKRFAGADLDDKDGFHWTRSAYADDDKQAWIVDPTSGSATTVPRDRKPFTIRCVISP